MQKKRRFQASKKIKISKAVRTLLILITIIIFASGLCNLLKSISTKKEVIRESTEVYKYTNNFFSTTKINLKNNQYVKESEIIQGQAYLSDLISSIDMNLNYKYSGSKQTEEKYNYKIETIVKSVYSDTNGSFDILNKTETLKESQNNVVNSDNFTIDEKISVDYSKYHQMIKEFKQTMGISADSNLFIRLTVEMTTNVNSKQVNNKYVSYYKISLGDKIALIDANESDKNTKTLRDEIQVENKIDMNVKDVIMSIIMMTVGLACLRIVLKKTEELKVIKNEFKYELNKIMRSYEDKIIEIESLKHIDIEHATQVKDITQLRKLADEEILPIYCYVEDDKEAYFIVSKYENNYIYILK